MQSEKKDSKLPRPWFITFNAVWKQLEIFRVFMEALEAEGAFSNFPYHQKRMDDSQLHTTVISLLKITDWPDEHSVETLVSNCLDDWITGLDFAPLKKVFTEFSLEAYEVRYFDTVSAVQFRCLDGRVAAFRQSVREFYRSEIDRLKDHLADSQVCSELQIDLSRNIGGHLHSAIARSTSNNETIKLSWSSLPLSIPAVRVEEIKLLVSDESMSNRLARIDGRFKNLRYS